MPFDFEEYQKKCNGVATEQLNREPNNNARQIPPGETSSRRSVLLSALTDGVSLVKLGLSARQKQDEMPEAGLHASHTWPLAPSDKERFPAGGQFPPTLHDYSLFGHPDEDVQEQLTQVTVQTQTVVYPPQTTSISSSSPSDNVNAFNILSAENGQNPNDHSQSIPPTASVSAIPQAQQECTTSRQAFQDAEDFGLLFSPDGTIRQAVPSASDTTISSNELGYLMPALTDEDEMMRVSEQELESRIDHSQPQLHRTSHVHASHGRRPHIKTERKLGAHRSSEKTHSSPDPTTTPQLPLPSSEEQHHPDQLAPILPPRSPSFPIRPYPSQAPQPPAMPPLPASLEVGVDVSQIQQTLPLPSRTPSLPVGLGTSENPPASSVQHYQFDYKPVPSDQQSYPSNTTSPQQAQLKNQRHDSGYYSTTSTPALPGSIDIPPCYSPQPLSTAASFQQKFTSQGPMHRDSQSSLSPTSPNSQPPPPYFAYQTVSEPSSLDGTKDYFNQATAINTSSYNPADYGISSGPKDGQNALGIQGWQWGTAFAAGIGDEKVKTPGEPDYGPPPPIPEMWKG